MRVSSPVPVVPTAGDVATQVWAAGARTLTSGGMQVVEGTPVTVVDGSTTGTGGLVVTMDVPPPLAAVTCYKPVLDIRFTLQRTAGVGDGICHLTVGHAAASIEGETLATYTSDATFNSGQVYADGTARTKRVWIDPTVILGKLQADTHKLVVGLALKCSDAGSTLAYTNVSARWVYLSNT